MIQSFMIFAKAYFFGEMSANSQLALSTACESKFLASSEFGLNQKNEKKLSEKNPKTRELTMNFKASVTHHKFVFEFFERYFFDGMHPNSRMVLFTACECKFLAWSEFELRKNTKQFDTEEIPKM